MAKTMSKTKLKGFRAQLEAEQQRLTELIEEHEHELEEARLTETAADRSPDPGNAEAGSMKFEYEKELSIERNTIDLLHKVERAIERIDDGTYGVCESCGSQIPIARLEVLPYATMCVTCASKKN
jgi:DnaK suppressor protein